jgi:putative acetyltransferase
MDYVIDQARERHYSGLHRAIDVVAHEKKFLAFTSAPALEQSIGFYRGLETSGSPHFVALYGDEVVGWVDVCPQTGEARAHVGASGIGLLPSARHKGLGPRLMPWPCFVESPAPLA